MTSEHPTILELPSEPKSVPPGRVDLVKIVVQGVLALYLLPVILLVAGIGVTSIVVAHTARLAARTAGLVVHVLPRRIRPGSAIEARVIGSQPIAVRKPRWSRVIR
jgi:hypothetical protein